ncbi:TPA: sacsin N-terminal ATP-binding-like domain-containing protein [Aeromonas hydrophila]
MIAPDAGEQNTATIRIADKVVIEATSRKVRTFLYELAEGTSNYRSLHSLTEQVEHQYHGRFIVELIQNAHDALLSTDGELGLPARIEIALKNNEGDFGTLYVANDGQPFSLSNFNSLSQLGQSDKNPQESIGNKGIGFRSVLEITHAPEIYSRNAPNSQHFDGFCFAFSPEVIRRLAAPILALLNGDNEAGSPFGDVPLVDWEAQLLEKFRASVAQLAKTANMRADVWLNQELSYLSPYLLPFPTDSRESSTYVAEFERRGFATLIRFPLKNAATLALVREKLDELDDSALLFLEKASSLVLDSDDKRRELSRQQVARPGSQLRGREVSISEGSNDCASRYWVWTRDIALVSSPEEIRTAVQQLPGKWPQLQEAAVSIGVRLGEKPESGALSIFLPTHLKTGCATHINAPFFGDMSRTHIDFGADVDKSSSSGAIYNHFLLSQAARLATSVIHEELAGRGLDEARATVDLLAPLGTDEGATKRWQQLTASAADNSGTEIKTTAWFLSDRGWGALCETSLLPTSDNPSILTPRALREHAAFAAYVEELDSRRELIEALSEANGIDAYPAKDDLANTVESIALGLHKDPKADWNGFWSDVDELFDGDCIALAGKLVLLGNDGQLHAGGGVGCTVFFIPRQGTSDEEEDENDGDVKEIPSTLRPFVAFLNEQIQVYEEKSGRLQQRRVRKMLLESKLVSRFRREDILNDVLIARLPPLPIPLTSPDAPLCRDILLWALRLMAHQIERGKAEKSLRQLRNLPAPCVGGWYPLAESSFGPGWPGTQGDVTENYLARIRTPETREAHQRLLLSPSDERWEGNGAEHIRFHRLVGVFDGIRLIPVDSKSWNSRFQAYRHSFLLPQNPPPGWSKNDWNEYCSVARNDARPIYNWGNYEIQRLYVFPGLDKYQEFDEETRKAMMEVVLGSVGHWEDGWGILSINRIKGHLNSIRLQSPLARSLSKLPWLGLQDGDVIEWSRPADRWHVPALELARGRKWQFSHLKPLPGELANRLDMDSRLAAMMRLLGTPRFDPETKSPSTQLLDVLADAVARGDVPHWDVFLGQVRSAWRGFEPTVGSPFPNRLLVQRGSSRLTAESPDEYGPAYLPDSSKSFLAALKHFELPVIAIETEDAKRLADSFTTAYPQSVLRASALQPVPLVDGEPLEKSPQDRLRDDAELEWVIPVLLTITAYFGPQSQGTTSKTFRKLLETFRNARLGFAEKIETGLFREEISVAPPLSVPALWLNASQVLLLSHCWKKDMPALSEALSNLIDREDLEIPIKLMLGITGAQPELKDIIHALEQLKLSEGHFRDVREHWRGDVGQIIEMLVPLLTLLRPDASIGELVEIDTDDAIIEFIDNLSDDRFDGQTIIQIARKSADMFEFGSKAFDLFGDVVQMSEWNAALALHDLKPLVNSDAQATFNAHLATSTQVLRCLLATLITRRPEAGTFRALTVQLNALACPEEFKTSCWNISFSQAHSATTPLLEQWGATSEEIEAVRESLSVEDLIDRLVVVGIDVTLDPLQAARDNRELLRQSLMRLQQIGLAWALGSGYPNPSDWECRIQGYLNHLSVEVETTAFTHVWDEPEVWSLLRKLPVDAPSTAFWSMIAATSSFDDLIVRLGLSNEDLRSASTQLDALREDARRRKKVVEVCGKEFDGSEDNLSGLWTHICSGFPAAALGDLTPVDLKKLSALENVATRLKDKDRDRDREPLNKPKQKHLSKSMENLIGLSGEIHAFRMLQHTYGASAVSATSWVSGNSAHVFPDNKTDDGRGCDFVVTLQDRTYYVEVKASEGESESFTLGSSEIRLAMGLAKKSRYQKKEIFLILRISNALSKAPSFQLLPNPYDPMYQTHFVIEEADARVRYRSKS